MLANPKFDVRFCFLRRKGIFRFRSKTINYVVFLNKRSTKNVRSCNNTVETKMTVVTFIYSTVGTILQFQNIHKIRKSINFVSKKGSQIALW